jgi:hypothetical protein
MKIVKAKCIICGHTQTIKAGDVLPGDHPMCDKCMSPMIPVSAAIDRAVGKLRR